MRNREEMRSREEIEWDEEMKKVLCCIFASAFFIGSGITYNESKHAIVTFEWASQKCKDPAILHGLMLLVIVFSHEVCLILFLIYSERWNPRITRFCIVPITAILVAPFCFHDPIVFAAIILNAAGGLLWYIAYRFPVDVKVLDLLISFAFGGLCYFGASWFWFWFGFGFGFGFSTFMVATSVHLNPNPNPNPNPTHKGAAGVREIRIIIEDDDDQRSGGSPESICLSRGSSAEPFCSDDDQRSGASDDDQTSGRLLLGPVRLAPPEPVFSQVDQRSGAFPEPICCDHGSRL